MWGDLKIDDRPDGVIKTPVFEPREQCGVEKFTCVCCGGSFTIDELRNHSCTYNPLPLDTRRKSLLTTWAWDP